MNPRSEGAPGGVAIVSDVHVSERRPESAEAFLEFLSGRALRGVSRLVLLGDLFDAWFGARMARLPFYRRVLDAIAAVGQRGVAVTFVAGNRDFLFDAATASEYSIEIEKRDALPVDAFSRRAVLLHGDTLCTHDVAYQRLRRVVRSGPARVAARTLPYGVLRAIADGLRRRSVTAVAEKPARVLEISREAAAAELLRAGARDVVCGHVHEAAIRALTTAGSSSESVDDGGFFLYTLGSWSGSGGTYAVLGPSGPRLVRHRSIAGRSEDHFVGGSAPFVSRGPIVTLDGPAGSGKSTIARELANRLDFRYLDSGALYRAVTWRALKDGVDLSDDRAVAAAVSRLAIELKDGRRVLLDGEDVTSHIREPDVTRHVSRVSEIAAVRAFLLPIQREQGKDGRLVAEGRDMGSVVFPDAERKIYLDASLEERASRRRAEILERGGDAPLDRVIEDMRRRDDLDSTRATAPLRRGDDFITLDTTGLSRDRVLEILIDLVRS